MVLQLKDKPVKQTVHLLCSAEKTNLRSRRLCDLLPAATRVGEGRPNISSHAEWGAAVGATDADVITELNLSSPICGKCNSCGEKEHQPKKKKSIANRAENWKRSKLRKALLNVFYVRAVQCYPQLSPPAMG